MDRRVVQMTSSPERTRSALAGALLALALAGCGGGEEAVVYVPGSTFLEALYIGADRGPVVRAQVGEPILLSAQRRSGPWRAVLASEVPEGGCSLASPPVQLEAEVADNITWTVLPDGSAAFNTGIREDRKRVVTFDTPGSYRLTASSASWCGEPFGSDTLEVEIHE